MKLRGYQHLGIENVFKARAAGNRSALVVQPTGTGKTVMFAGAARKVFPRRVLVVAHRQELIWQARDKIKSVTGLDVGVEMGEYKVSLDRDMFKPRARIVVATVQTLMAGGDGGGRIGKFDPMDFDLLVIDEAHHSTSPMYRTIIKYFVNANPNLFVLGVTATPDRGDEEALGQIFETVAFEYELFNPDPSVPSAIRDGWLVPIEQQMVSVASLDLSQVKTRAGDLANNDLAAVLEAEKNLHGIAYPTIEILGGQQGIGFAASVAHAQNLADIFNRHRIGMSACVSAKTDPIERKQIIDEFRKGGIQFLWNCGIFTEGTDFPNIGVVSMGRMTKSRCLYAQMAGRVTRPHETIAKRLGEVPDVPSLRRALIARSLKPSGLIIDFVGNSGKHKLVTTGDILGGNISPEVLDLARDAAIRSGGRVRMDQVIEDEEKKLAERKEREVREFARKERIVAKANYSSQRIDPFNLLDIRPAQERGWDKGRQLSERQKSVLRNSGFDPDKMQYAQAKQLVGIIIERWDKKKCSLAQVNLLKKFGLDGKEWSKERAKRSLDQIAKNNWQVPHNFDASDATEPKVEAAVPF
jgi:superfamily II DNA or RNA helicase